MTPGARSAGANMLREHGDDRCDPYNPYNPAHHTQEEASR